MPALLESGGRELLESGGYALTEQGEPPAPIPLFGIVQLFGKPGTFGAKRSGLMSTGQTFQIVPVPDWQFNKGVSAWFPAVMSDGQVVIPGQPLATSSFKPTADHMEYSVWDPTAQTLTAHVIPTTTGQLAAIGAGQTTVGGADFEDAQVVTIGGGEEVCVLTSGRPYDNWLLATYGYYPAMTLLKKSGGTWVYDSARSKTAPQIAATNPIVVTATDNFPTGTNGFSETFTSGRNLSELGAPLPHSNYVVVGHYDDKQSSSQNGGVISVLDPANGFALIAAFRIPNVTDAETSPLGLRPREIQTDPSSDTDDERFTVIYDTFFDGAATTPIYTNGLESGTVTGWTSAFTTALLAINTTTVRTGTYSIRLTSNVSNTMEADAPIAGKVPVVPGQKYSVAGYCQPDATVVTPKNAVIGMKWTDASGASKGQSNSFPILTVASTFTKISGTVQAPSGAVFGYPYVQNQTITTAQIYYWDDFTVTANNTSGAAPFTMQEFAFNKTAGTIVAKSAPVLSSISSSRYESMCYDRYGTLYLGQTNISSGVTNQLATAVYQKRSAGRQFVVDNPADGTWTSGGTTSQWGIPHTPDYLVSPSVYTTNPVGMFFDDPREVLVIPSSNGALSGLKVGRVGGGLQFADAWTTVDLGLNDIRGSVPGNVVATKPVYDFARSLLWWPIRQAETVNTNGGSWPAPAPYRLDQWLYSLNIAALLDRGTVQPTRITVTINDRTRKATVAPADRHLVEVLFP